MAGRSERVVPSIFGRRVDELQIAFFQDEHHYCQERFAFLNTFNVECVYTLLEPRYWDAVYRELTSVKRLVHTLTGYLSADFVERARVFGRPDAARTIDIGYRARRLPFYMGRGGQEKSDIADRFIERSAGSRLVLDIAVGESSRLYGDAWWNFLANCRGVLGVEAGVSVFDLDGSARVACELLPTARTASDVRRGLQPSAVRLGRHNRISNHQSQTFRSGGARRRAKSCTKAATTTCSSPGPIFCRSRRTSPTMTT